MNDKVKKPAYFGLKLIRTGLALYHDELLIYIYFLVLLINIKMQEKCQIPKTDIAVIFGFSV